MTGHEHFNHAPGRPHPKKDRKITLKVIAVIFVGSLLYSPALSLIAWFVAGNPSEQDLAEFAQLETAVENSLLGDPGRFCSTLGFVNGLVPLVMPPESELLSLQRKIKAARLGLWPFPLLPALFGPLPFPVPLAQDSWLASAKFRIDPMRVEQLETVAEPSAAREYLATGFVSAERSAWKGRGLVSKPFTLKLGTDLTGLVVTCKGSGGPVQYSPQAICEQRAGYTWDMVNEECKPESKTSPAPKE